MGLKGKVYKLASMQEGRPVERTTDRCYRKDAINEAYEFSKLLDGEIVQIWDQLDAGEWELLATVKTCA